MKKVIILILIISSAILLTNSFADNNEKPLSGEIIFKQKGCTACHGPNMIGPAIEKIASAYQGKEDDLIKFLKGQGEAIVDPKNKSWMKSQIEKTKSMNDEELKALVKYILSSNQQPTTNNKQK